MLHVPKTGGTSVMRIFRAWFGEGFLSHYFDRGTNSMPTRHDLATAHRPERPVVVYGHFNASRGFGVADYYPQVKQFVTIVRDPFERAVSGYFYVQQQFQRGASWWEGSRPAAMTLREYLSRKSEGPPLLFSPISLTLDNYREILEMFFVEIGITEKLDESLRRIARSLAMDYDSSMLPTENRSLRTQEIPNDLRESFIERHPLEYAIYNYAAARFDHGESAGVPGHELGRGDP